MRRIREEKKRQEELSRISTPVHRTPNSSDASFDENNQTNPTKSKEGDETDERTINESEQHLPAIHINEN